MMRRSRSTPVALLGAVVTAALVVSGPNAAVSPKLSCRIARALERLPAQPVWFPVPQPAPSTLTVDAAAAPGFAHGLKWSIEDRYFWLVRLPVGGKTGDPRARRVFNATFDNLGRPIDVRRRGDGRLFAQFKTAGSGPDVTVVLAKNMTATEFGEFLASLRKVRYPTGC